MSLAALLISGDSKATGKSANQVALSKKPVDEGLDALFRSNPAPAVTPKPLKGTPIVVPSNPSAISPARGQKRKTHQEPIDVHPVSAKPNVKPEVLKASKRRKVLKPVRRPDSSSEDEEADDAQLEDSYLTQRHAQKVTAEEKSAESGHGSSDGEEEEEEDEDEDAPPPMHETHSASTKTRHKSHKKAKYIPSDERPAQRDARTIFVGNIPVDVAQSKSSQKQLKRHFLSRVPGSKIESMRFRSVAFASATSALPGAEEAKSARDTPSTKQQRQQERAAKWREKADGNGKSTGKASRGHESETSDREDDRRAKKPTHHDQAEKKRVAFIKRDFHKEVDTVNAYVVFAYESPSSAGGESGALRPFEAARLAVESCDGTTFLDRTIRVDRVGRWQEGCGAEMEVVAGGKGDPRTTLFVGNLDFAAKEEELRVWFEGVVSQECGPCSNDSNAESDEEQDGAEKLKTWVKSVRIVRDKGTQLGKGFAYVRFADRECVDEVLALEQAKLKFAKRKLRVQRCKVVTPGGLSAPSKPKSSSAARKPVQAKRTNAPPPTSMPHGDPALGAKLAGLSKDERKAAKASNVDRVKRRLAKKKVKAEVDKAKIKSGARVRDRERKTAGGKGKGKPVNKSRMRSEKSTQKRNMKK